jgi:hypothetical protein
MIRVQELFGGLIEEMEGVDHWEYDHNQKLRESQPWKTLDQKSLLTKGLSHFMLEYSLNDKAVCKNSNLVGYFGVLIEETSE